MNFLVDMNLSPQWVPVLEAAGFTAAHWSTIGDARAPDVEILRWARGNAHVVFTHDLDFGAIRAATQAENRSVFQVRTQDVDSDMLSRAVIDALRRYDAALAEGAIVVLDQRQSRVRIFPLKR